MKRAPTPEVKIAAPKAPAPPSEIIAMPARNPITGAGVVPAAAKPAAAQSSTQAGMRW
jgi:hypothetical protein